MFKLLLITLAASVLSHAYDASLVGPPWALRAQRYAHTAFTPKPAPVHSKTVQHFTCFNTEKSMSRSASLMEYSRCRPSWNRREIISRCDEVCAQTISSKDLRPFSRGSTAKPVHQNRKASNPGLEISNQMNPVKTNVYANVEPKIGFAFLFLTVLGAATSLATLQAPPPQNGKKKERKKLKNDKKEKKKIFKVTLLILSRIGSVHAQPKSFALPSSGAIVLAHYLNIFNGAVPADEEERKNVSNLVYRNTYFSLGDALPQTDATTGVFDVDAYVSQSSRNDHERANRFRNEERNFDYNPAPKIPQAWWLRNDDDADNNTTGTTTNNTTPVLKNEYKRHSMMMKKQPAAGGDPGDEEGDEYSRLKEDAHAEKLNNSHNVSGVINTRFETKKSTPMCFRFWQCIRQCYSKNKSAPRAGNDYNTPLLYKQKPESDTGIVPFGDVKIPTGGCDTWDDTFLAEVLQNRNPSSEQRDYEAQLRCTEFHHNEVIPKNIRKFLHSSGSLKRFGEQKEIAYKKQHAETTEEWKTFILGFGDIEDEQVKKELNVLDGLSPDGKRTLSSEDVIDLSNSRAFYNGVKSHSASSRKTLLENERTTDTMQVLVRLGSGRTIALDICPEDTVFDVKQSIQDKEGYPPIGQWLTFEKKPLYDDQIVRKSGISPGSTIEHRARIVGGGRRVRDIVKAAKNRAAKMKRTLKQKLHLLTAEPLGVPQEIDGRMKDYDVSAIPPTAPLADVFAPDQDEKHGNAFLTILNEHRGRMQQKIDGSTVVDETETIAAEVMAKTKFDKVSMNDHMIPLLDRLEAEAANVVKEIKSGATMHLIGASGAGKTMIVNSFMSVLLEGTKLMAFKLPSGEEHTTARKVSVTSRLDMSTNKTYLLIDGQCVEEVDFAKKVLLDKKVIVQKRTHQDEVNHHKAPLSIVVVNPTSRRYLHATLIDTIGHMAFLEQECMEDSVSTLQRQKKDGIVGLCFNANNAQPPILSIAAYHPRENDQYIARICVMTHGHNQASERAKRTFVGADVCSKYGAERLVQVSTGNTQEILYEMELLTNQLLYRSISACQKLDERRKPLSLRARNEEGDLDLLAKFLMKTLKYRLYEEDMVNYVDYGDMAKAVITQTRMSMQENWTGRYEQAKFESQSLTRKPVDRARNICNRLIGETTDLSVRFLMENVFLPLVNERVDWIEKRVRLFTPQKSPVNSVERGAIITAVKTGFETAATRARVGLLDAISTAQLQAALGVTDVSIPSQRDKVRLERSVKRLYNAAKKPFENVLTNRMRSWFDNFWDTAFHESTLELKRSAEEEDSIPKRMSFREPDPFEDLRGTDAQVFAKQKLSADNVPVGHSGWQAEPNAEGCPGSAAHENTGQKLKACECEPTCVERLSLNEKRQLINAADSGVDTFSNLVRKLGISHAQDTKQAFQWACQQQRWCSVVLDGTELLQCDPTTTTLSQVYSRMEPEKRLIQMELKIPNSNPKILSLQSHGNLTLSEYGCCDTFIFSDLSEKPKLRGGSLFGYHGKVAA